MASSGNLCESAPAERFCPGACASGKGEFVAGWRPRSGALLALHRRGVTGRSAGAGSHRTEHDSGAGGERTGDDRRAAFVAAASGKQKVIEPTGGDRGLAPNRAGRGFNRTRRTLLADNRWRLLQGCHSAAKIPFRDLANLEALALGKQLVLKLMQSRPIPCDRDSNSEVHFSHDLRSSFSEQKSEVLNEIGPGNRITGCFSTTLLFVGV